ncbi:MAG: hypothetical protein KF700_08170 [Hyphomonadaceae bacterium]|nr:hypothetical protein [Hyphomonadaceae bacterium]
MKPPEQRNLEHRSNNALLCFCIGAGLCTGAYVLGIGAVIGAALSGGDPASLVGGALAAVGLVLLGVSGFVLLLVGGVWMFVQVLADQRGGAEEKRYRDVER